MVSDSDLPKLKNFDYHPNTNFSIPVSFIARRDGYFKFRRLDTLNEIWLTDLSKISYSPVVKKNNLILSFRFVKLCSQ